MSLVLVEDKGSYRELVLNRVDKHNALSSLLVTELTSILAAFSEDALQGKFLSLIIRSASPKAFCAGADLTERMSMTDGQVLETLSSLGNLMNTIASFPLPTIAVLEGVAFGGGFELALACDLRFAHPATQMGLTEVRLAIIPGAGGTQRLSRLVGPAVTKELVFSAKKIIAGDNKYSVCNYVGEDALEAARNYCNEVAQAGPRALIAAKKAINGGDGLDLEQGLLLERECYKMVLKTADRREALEAFQQKRKPTFIGK